MSFKSTLDKTLNSRLMVDVLSESQLKAINRNFIKSSDIEQLLTSNNIPHMIVGAHALGEITSEPRATQDVDVVVRDVDYKKTIETIIDEYPYLKPDGNRIKDQRGNVLVDVLTDAHPIYKIAMDMGGRTPDPEMVLVMKFLSGVSPLRRKDKKLQDKADFFNVVDKIDVDEERVLDLLKKADPEYVLNKDKIIDWIKEAK